MEDGAARFNGILTVRRDGTLTGAGLIYEELTNSRIHETFEPGIEEVGYNQYAYTLAGERVLVRTRAGVTDQPTVTEEGRRYFERFPEENLYNIPARHWYYDNGRLRGGSDTTFTLTLRQIMDWAEQHDVNPASIVTQAQANRQAHANLEAFLRQLPDAADEFRRWADKLAGHKLLDVASGQFWTWDSGDRVTVDQRITVVDAEGRSRSRVFMHRLLRGSVCFPDALDRDGLCCEAMENTGACVVRQLCICFEERTRGTTRTDHTWTWTKTLTLEMANACFDEAFRELGFQEGVAPYSGTGGWREQGVSYEMFEYAVEKLGACCYVYHNSDLAFFIDGRKEGKFVAPNQRQPCLAVSLWGEHAFMYTGERAREIRMSHPTARGLRDEARKTIMSHNYVDQSCPFDKQIELRVDDLQPLLDLRCGQRQKCR